MKEKLLNLKKKVLKYSPNVYFEAIEKNGKNRDFFMTLFHSHCICLRFLKNILPEGKF